MIVDENIFGLEVAVGDEVGVGICDSADDLFEEEAGLVLADVIVLDVIVKFATFCVFHYHKDVVGRVQYFVELDDVLMVDKLKDAYFPLDLSLGR